MRRFTSEVPLFAGFLRVLSLLAVLMTTACGGGGGGGGAATVTPGPTALPPPPVSPPPPPVGLEFADYTAISIAGGTLEADAMATDINNLGQVVGATGPNITNSDAVLWGLLGTEVVSTQSLGTLAGGEHSRAMAINDIGQVVGWSSDGSTRRPFVWSAGNGMVDLGIPPSFPAAIANDINESGQVVGAIYPVLDGGAWTYVFNSRFMVWTVDEDGIPLAESDQGTFGGLNAAAFANNNAGLVAGASYRESDYLRPVGLLWSEPNGPVEIGDPMEVVAINDFDEAAGFSLEEFQGYYWSTTDGIIDIPEGLAADINNSGQVVGATTDLFESAFIWEDGEAMFLPPPPLQENRWQRYYATAINDAGWVVGYSTPDWQAILWVPNSP
jgi:probable HAF family extracellular repeat protein